MSWDQVKRELARQLVATLEATLPKIGGQDWWRTCVLDQLSPSQQEIVAQRPVGALSRLDLAALLRVCDRNWREMARVFGFPADAQFYVRELRSARNRWAHETVDGVAEEEVLRDLDTALRFMRAVNGDVAFVSILERERRVVLRRLATEDVPSNGERGHWASEPPSASTDHDGSGDDPRLDNVVRSAVFGRAACPAASDEVPVARTPIGNLRDQPDLLAHLRRLLAETTFVGIDFGTSTTAASLVRLDEVACALVAEPIPINQINEIGRASDHHLVPSCLAWKGGRLIFGGPAARLRHELTEGKDVWSSFKMELGIDLGPRYFHTVLKEGGPGPTIERPQDATREFLRCIRIGVEDAIEGRGLPNNIRYVVSVPASFEANQRQDLINALTDAGISLDSSCLIDEPNAAFLSYLHDSATSSSGFATLLENEPRRVLVFDFGAGTCDISILEVASEGGRITSMNRSISRFLALGGNNVDHAIARRVLLPQLLADVPPDFELTTDQVSRLVIPRLMPEAERLKIQCCRVLETRGAWTVEAARGLGVRMNGSAVPPITVMGTTLRLERPEIDFSAFVDVMMPFLASCDDEGFEDEGRGDLEAVSIFAPIQNALSKAGMDANDLHAVLFIGGSSQNPLVREAIKSQFGRFVEPLIPADLRTHVSQGAALHALMFHGMGLDMVRPITSEPVLVLTAGGGLVTVLPAGTVVPSPEINATRLSVERDGQCRIELPICVSNENKMLAVLSADANSPGGFRAGDEVRISCHMTRDKLLKVNVRVNDVRVDAALLNPLANQELSPSQLGMLKARQQFNEAVLGGTGRPSIAAVLAYAEAAKDAKEYSLAAEMYDAAERLDQTRNFATAICYCWSNARRWDRSERWARLAFEREPSSVTAYNFSIQKLRQGDHEGFRSLIEKALELDPNNTAALDLLGRQLREKKDARGTALLERCLTLLEEELESNIIDEDDCGRLATVAFILGRPDLVACAKNRRDSLSQVIRPYEDENLVAGPAETKLQTRS